MEIHSDTRVVKGKHKGLDFTYRAGLLELYNKAWTQIEIRKLVEIANLLSVQGYALEVRPKKEKRRPSYGFSSFLDVDYGFDPTDPIDTPQEDDLDEPEGN